MAIELIDKIKPKNNGSFAMVDAVDVELPDGTRLAERLEQTAAEEWEFTMEDGTVVKKKVLLSHG